ncbi:MAG TPA: FHA domain-containing protein [Thermoanaerobaculia bacterium]|jgi:DNA-binding winged helix-turn-helix (wHTH) protein
MRVRIGPLLFDPLQRQLHRDDATTPLTPKAAKLLEALVEAAPDPLSHEALYQRLWPGTFVEPGNLHNLIAEIRNAAGDAKVIRTIHRFGYALAEKPESVGARYELITGDERIALADGETIIGREQLNTADVSRRHARITIDGSTATLEDLGSKNGTFVGTRRLEAPLALHDGDEIVFGRTPVRFVVTPLGQTTVTISESGE